MCAAECHPEAQGMLPVGDHRIRGIFRSQLDDTLDVLVGVARVGFGDNLGCRDALFQQPALHQLTRGGGLNVRWVEDAAGDSDQIVVAGAPDLQAALQTHQRLRSNLVLAVDLTGRNEQDLHDTPPLHS